MNKIIDVKNLSYSYHNGKTALKDINFTVYNGDTLGIIGPNGAGKTTLLLHLNGVLLSKNSENIKILNMELNKRNINAVKKKINIVFQNPDDQLFSTTVFDDVAFGPLNLGLGEEEVKNRVKDALSYVKMSGYEKEFPQHLSFGEKKKIAIATVLSMKPEILVFDEPSANLDPKSRRELIELLKGISSTKLIAGHDLELVLEVCNKILILNNGKVIAKGGTYDILSNKLLMDENALEVPLSLRYFTKNK